ncbi:MAG: hypothetical protein CMK70_00015 [Pseudohongiella sp.]|nr:hypothetical protein [Pseudohongiella sp.]|tara:strand:- start:6505 stop:7434 length:930 start_codon:yes stop_codon:yes gene_type:complete
MKPGRKFEHLAAEVFSAISANRPNETVTHDVLLPSPDGPRQIDVLIEGKVGPFSVKTIIECKDYNKNVNVIAVDSLHSKAQDVNAQKAVLVARKGFTNGAKKKAKRLGIALCTLHSMEHEAWKFDLEIPIIITEYSCVKYAPIFLFKFSDSENQEDTVIVNGTPFIRMPEDKTIRSEDIPFNKILANYWNSNEIDCDEGTTRHVADPHLTDSQWISFPDGRCANLIDTKIMMTLVKKYYLGYANSIKSAKYINYIEEDRRDVLFDPSELSDYQKTFSMYTKLGDLPNVNGPLQIRVKILHNPELVPNNA